MPCVVVLQTSQSYGPQSQIKKDLRVEQKLKCIKFILFVMTKNEMLFVFYNRMSRLF